MVHGGIWASEHPAPPRNPEHVSTWTAAVTELHPDISLSIVMQYVWGATAPKPTGLLSLRMPRLVKDMYVHAVPGAVYPKDVAIGRDPGSGQFRTTAHKAYPDHFCAGISNAFAQRLKQALRQGQVVERHIEASDPLYSWLVELITASKVIRSDARWLPDYQG